MTDRHRLYGSRNAGLVAVLATAWGAAAWSAGNDLVASFWAEYAHNFDLKALKSVELCVLTEDVLLRPRRREVWQLISCGMDATTSYYQTFVVRLSGASGERRSPSPPKGRLEAAGEPYLSGYWRNEQGLYSTSLFPPSRWRILPAEGRRAAGQPRVMLTDVLREFGFRAGGVLFPPDTGVSYEYRPSDRAIVVRFPRVRHHFEYELPRDQALNGLPQEVRMLNQDGKVICTWKSKDWRKVGNVWLPSVLVKDDFMLPDETDFRKALSTPARRETWRVIDARFNEPLHSMLSRPTIPEGAEVLDERFGVPLLYHYDSRRTREQLLDMARQAQIKRTDR